ncbi:MAG: hypothetical protein MRECE_2c095 [Mycoplasmataceae bacterium CE_OT135]|nr:MAG: hypothetical protein MRECE_2c095 [Mycoplasmataceae bacterium CE_OT135]
MKEVIIMKVNNKINKNKVATAWNVAKEAKGGVN